MIFKKGVKDKDKEPSRKVFINDDYDDDDEELYEVEDEDELKAYGDARRQRVRKRKLRRRRVVVLVLFVLLAAFLYLNWSTFAPASVADSVQGFFSAFGQSKYPVGFDDGMFKVAVPLGSDVGVLTDTSFLLYSQKGDQLAVRPHGINDPEAVSGGGKALIFDHGGRSFRVETRFGEPFGASASDTITTAAMGDGGNFAVVTESEDYLSELTVYDNDYKNVFRWDASQGRILTAALSPDEKMLAAVVVGARNGDFYSDIYIFNLNSKNPVAIDRYDGELLYSIKFKDNKRIAAVGDGEAVFLYSNGKQVSDYSYGDNELEGSANGDGPVVLAFKNGGDDSKVVSLDGEGKQLGTATVKAGDVSIVANGDGKTVLVSGTKLWHLNDNCSGAASVDVSGNVLSAFVAKDYAYIFGSQSIGKYRLS